jgi:hypothetical protein
VYIFHTPCDIMVAFDTGGLEEHEDRRTSSQEGGGVVGAERVRGACGGSGNEWDEEEEKECVWGGAERRGSGVGSPGWASREEVEDGPCQLGLALSERMEGQGEMERGEPV